MAKPAWSMKDLAALSFNNQKEFYVSQYFDKSKDSYSIETNDDDTLSVIFANDQTKHISQITYNQFNFATLLYNLWIRLILIYLPLHLIIVSSFKDDILKYESREIQ